MMRESNFTYNKRKSIINILKISNLRRLIIVLRVIFYANFDVALFTSSFLLLSP